MNFIAVHEFWAKKPGKIYVDTKNHRFNNKAGHYYSLFTKN